MPVNLGAVSSTVKAETLVLSQYLVCHSISLKELEQCIAQGGKVGDKAVIIANNPQKDLDVPLAYRHLHLLDGLHLESHKAESVATDDEPKESKEL
ncbi:hypothetical protein DSO57_1007657 [Entomophthora muscae]|uniref:Uncharacterized protein n=1 Tax=Entomophthora muscae TaxID=34485 RepID=A0ACC2T754_9FUNG|nr:hypothetical protein DSO57_1007657 [Entomophthora muscae]